VLCLYQGEDTPSSRIRVLQMLPYLTNVGLACDAAPYPRRLTQVVSVLARSGNFDLIWLQKKLLSPLDRILWRRAKAPIVFDFDDAIFFRQAPKNGSYASPNRARRFAGVVGLASGVTCGNRYLASLLPTGTRNVFLYPSPAPTDVPMRDYRQADRPFHLGWIGGGGNLASLARIGPSLQALAKSRAFVLRVISNREFHLPGVCIENILWSLAGQAAALAELDAGLMPLDADSPFDRGKCSYKLLQYMAAGVVPVGSAVGMNTEIIEDGRNGRLVWSEADWGGVLTDLMTVNMQTLSTMGLAARFTAVNGFSYDVLASGLAGFFRSLVSRGRHDQRHPQSDEHTAVGVGSRR